jgi:hypothetical protein
MKRRTATQILKKKKKKKKNKTLQLKEDKYEVAALQVFILD